MSDRIDNPMFMHCRACIQAGRPASCEVATNGVEIQVWCQTCDREISTMPLWQDFIQLEECGGSDHDDAKEANDE